MSAPLINSTATIEPIQAMRLGGITIAQPNEYDTARTFTWLKDDSLRYDFHYPTKPTLASFLAEWSQWLSDPYQHVFSVHTESGQHIGNAGIKNVTAKTAEVWLYIGIRSDRRRGYGQKILTLLESFIINKLPSDMAILHVRHDNVPALALYKKFNYVELPWNGFDHTGFDKKNIVFLGKELI